MVLIVSFGVKTFSIFLWTQVVLGCLSYAMTYWAWRQIQRERLLFFLKQRHQINYKFWLEINLSELPCRMELSSHRIIDGKHNTCFPLFCSFHLDRSCHQMVKYYLLYYLNVFIFLFFSDQVFSLGRTQTHTLGLRILCSVEDICHWRHLSEFILATNISSLSLLWFWSFFIGSSARDMNT